MSKLLQTIFDNAYLGIIQQQGFCYGSNFQTCSETGETIDDGDEACFYRHGGRSCAIGHSITDDNYSPILEGSGAWSDGVREALAASLDTTIDEICGLNQKIDTLQGIHDNAAPEGTIEDFMINMKKYAVAYDLVIPPLPRQETQLCLDI